jgi:hypothetical protein
MSVGQGLDRPHVPAGKEGPPISVAKRDQRASLAKGERGVIVNLADLLSGR